MIRLWAGQSWIQILAGTRGSSHLLKCPEQFWGPLSLLFSDTGVLPRGVKWQGHEVGLSPLSQAEVKNEWNFAFSPLYAFVALRGTTVPFLL
jgi:hypothetical protein